MQQLVNVGDRLRELLALSLQQPPLPAHIYRYILNFIASNPTPEQIAAFSPIPAMQQRLRTLVEPSFSSKITELERIQI